MADNLFATGINQDVTVYAKWVETKVEIVTKGLEFSLKEDNTYEVVAYTGSDLEIYIPKTHLDKPVTSIARITTETNFTSIHLSSNIFNIDEGMHSFSNISQITVDETNLIYSSKDGVLFNKDQTTLLWYPIGKGATYVVPNGVITIGEGAFRDNRVISSITLPSSLITIEDKAFWGTDKLTSINIPNSVVSIGWNAFYVSGLESLILSSSLETIGRGAFAGTNISSIVFHSAILEIGSEAFAVSNNLQSITIHANTPPILGEDAFRNMTFGGYNENLVIYVPLNSVNNYKAASNWDVYSGIITNISPN